MFSMASSSLSANSAEPFHQRFGGKVGGGSEAVAGRRTQLSSIKSIANAVVTEGSCRKTPHPTPHRQRNSSMLSTDHHLPNGGGVSSSVLHQRLRSLAANEMKRRRRVFSSGASADFLYVVSLALATLVFLAHFDSLQRDADNRFVDLEHHLPLDVYVWLDDVTRHGVWTAVAAFSIVCVGIRESTTRFTFLLMLLLFSWLAIGALHFFGDAASIPSRDALLTRFAFSTLAVTMNLAVIILPKKLKHKIRPNTIYSAFSASSTPLSQCTMASDLDDHSAVDGAEEPTDADGHRHDAHQSGSNQSSSDHLSKSFCATSGRNQPSTLFNSPPVFNNKRSSTFSTPVKIGSSAFASPFDRRWNAWREPSCDVAKKTDCNTTVNHLFVDDDEGGALSSMIINQNSMVGNGSPYRPPFSTTSTTSCPPWNIFAKNSSDFYHYPMGSSPFRGGAATVSTSTTSMMMSMTSPMNEQLPSLLKHTPSGADNAVMGKRREKTPEICGMLDGFSLRSSEMDNGSCDEKKSGGFF